MTAFTAYVLIPVYTFLFCHKQRLVPHQFFRAGKYCRKKRSLCPVGTDCGNLFLFYSPENYPPYAPKADSQLAGLSCSGAVGLCCYHALSSRADALKGQSPHCLCFSCCCLSDHLPVFHCAPTVPDCGTKKQNHLPVVSGRAGSHCADFRLSVCSGRNCQQRPGNLFYCFRYPYGLPAISAGLPPSISCCAFCSAFFFRRFRKKSESMVEQVSPRIPILVSTWWLKPSS